jgi:hypothetical protein
MAAVRVVSAGRLDLEQVSALAVREGELVAVGDEERAVVTATLGGDELGPGTRHVVAGDGKSDWEAVAADGAGRVFAIEEATASIAVLGDDLTEQVHSIELRAEDGPDRRARKLLAGDNRGPEGMLLLAGGHVLVVKQRKPVMLVEFGRRRDDAARGFSPAAQLAAGAAFELSGGSRTKLFPLRSWKLRDEDEDDVESANDLAVDDEGRLHAISSRTYCIYELRPEGDEVAVARRWELPAGVGADEDRNAEGLAFDARGRPVVALDVKDSGDNVFVLDRLQR